MKKAGPYEQAILLLDEHSEDGQDKKRKRAQALLEEAVALCPGHAGSHAALGYACDLDNERPRALACLREAHRLDPDDEIAEVYLLTLLAEQGPEKAALQAVRAAAPRHGVDLARLGRELAKAKFPRDARTLVTNGFIHARNFFRHRVGEYAERMRNRRQPGRARRQAAAERAQCVQLQQALAAGFDAARVPEALRPLAAWAARYGVGDDGCRPYLMKRLTRKQKAALIRAVDRKSKLLQRWLDSFAPGSMSNEAAAYLYLAEGVEEIRTP
ncbi:MAG TPA: hypothetical protein VHG88_00135 [Burkholderiales bacterium]|nr:hypothetical protein [Burkholderiales bacterium]